METTFYFLQALILIRNYREQNTQAQKVLAANLSESMQRLAGWAERCPANFSAKHLLVAAEVTAIEGDELTAERRYNQAIQTARQGGFLH